nr:Ribulose-phosphate 3-epimerase [uncultured bacterium]
MKIAPSILAADQLRLGEEVRRMIAAGCDLLHVDVMDAHFVPNMSFGPNTVEALHRAFPALPLDVHLMMDNPERYVEVFAEAGAWGITVHDEIAVDVGALLRRIRSLGCSAGLALKPMTPARAVRHLLRETDMVLVMTVEPGFGGQPFNGEMVHKLDDLRELGWNGLIEADGGLKAENLPLLASHGLDVAVMGTALFTSSDPEGDIRRFHAMGNRS